MSVVDAQYEDLVEAGGADRSGNHPVNVPRTTANAALFYRFQPVPVTIGAYVKHSSGFYTDTANRHQRPKGTGHRQTLCMTQSKRSRHSTHFLMIKKLQGRLASFEAAKRFKEAAPDNVRGV